ncbi:SDR family oxidoreductase [bacterium]|nr:SDR family oxidoreductase [bacterium]
MANILVTGGAGFIGSNLVIELLKQNHHIRVLDNFSTGKRENLHHLLDKIELIEGDLRSAEIVLQACEGMDYVLHHAALPSVPRSIADPISTTTVNVIGTLNLLNAARHQGIQRLIFASSSSIYGNSSRLPKSETMKPEPLSPYAVSKMAAEEYCRFYYQHYGLETVCLRYFNVFGPRQNVESQYSAVIPKFIHAIQHQKQPLIFGDGTQSRDFTFIENVIEANLLALTAPNIAGKVINIAAGVPVSLQGLVVEINSLTDSNIPPLYAPTRNGDVKHSHADISTAKRLLKYQVKVPFKIGLKKTVEWYQRHEVGNE